MQEQCSCFRHVALFDPFALLRTFFKTDAIAKAQHLLFQILSDRSVSAPKLCAGVADLRNFL